MSSITSTLLVRVAAHEGDAWERLVDLYGPLVYSWCRKMNVSAADSRDISQDVFVAVWKRIEKFRRVEEGDTFLGWLRTITSRKVHDHWRKANKESAISVPELPEAVVDPLIDGDEELDSANRELYARVVAFVKHQVSRKHWEAFWRVTVQQEPAGEVAESLGMERHNVYKIKSRVLRMVREAFGETL